MIPPELPQSARDDPRRTAEIKVYEALREQLPNEFRVYYSRPWRARQPDGTVLEGEADFVIASSEWGILVVEVKGGRIDRDGSTDHWTSTDRNQRTHDIRNPVDQVRQWKHVLLNRLKRYPWFKDRYINIAYAVILPDCSPPSRDLGIDMPLEVFAWAEHMDGLNRRLMRVLSPGNTRGLECNYVGETGMQILDDLLARSFHLELRFGSMVGPGKRRIVELTQNQSWVLDGLSRNLRMAVVGGAGTGKTVLAFERAERLARNGLKVLLLCYTKELAEHLQRAGTEIGNLTIQTYHSFAATVCREAGIDLEIAVSEQEKVEFYERTLPELLFGVVATPTGPRFDALIVDEAQDFPELWWTTLECVLRDPDQACIYVFYDDNQNVFRRTARFLDTFRVFRLTKNLRNAKTIFQSFACYYRGDLYEAGNDCAGEISFHPQVTDASSLIEFSKELLTREQIPATDIVLLSCTRLTLSRFSPENVRRTLMAEKLEWAAIKTNSIRRFKGLESPVVVLLDVEDALSDLSVL